MECHKLSNDEIREKLLSFGVVCGPVTDSTRNLYIKKIEKQQEKQLHSTNKVDVEHYSDDQLRAALKIYNVTVGPINSVATRTLYIKKLKDFMSKLPNDGQEPMDIELNFSPVGSDEEL